MGNVCVRGANALTFLSFFTSLWLMWREYETGVRDDHELCEISFEF
jgi:hypothetical protein